MKHPCLVTIGVLVFERIRQKSAFQPGESKPKILPGTLCIAVDKDVFVEVFPLSTQLYMQ